MSDIWNSFTDYIIKNYKDSKKIIEVGVGRILEPSDILKEKLTETNIVLIDINPANNEIIKEDIFNPTSSIYKDADLIYSIRPPEELQKAILNLGTKYCADVIIKPFFTEAINNDLHNRLKLVNYKKSVFYIHREK